MDVYAAFSKWLTQPLSVSGRLYCRDIMKDSIACCNRNRSGRKSNPRCGLSALDGDACTVARKAIAKNNFLANAKQTKHTQPDRHGDCVSFVTAQGKQGLEIQNT